MNTLFLHLSLQGDACHAWLSSAAGIEDMGQGTLEDFARQHPGSSCVAFFPSSQCLFANAAVSAKQLRQATQSLAWLIEDQVGEDVENLHVIAGIHQSGDMQNASSTPLLTIAHSTLQEHILNLRAAGLSLFALLPDLLLVARDKSEWQLTAWSLNAQSLNEQGLDVQANDQVALRTGILSGAVLEASALEAMLQAALQERDSAEPLSISVAMTDAALIARVQAWADQKNTVECHFIDKPAIASTLNATGDWSKHPANFLQGKFSATPAFTLPPSLRMAAVFIALAFSIQLFSEWVYLGYYSHQASKVGDAIVARYKVNYPQERVAATKALDDVKKRIKGHSNEGKSDGNVLPALTRMAESLQGSGLETQRIDYSGDVITLDVDAHALTDIDSLKQKLQSQGFQTDIVSANTQGSVIRGRLRIAGGS